MSDEQPKDQQFEELRDAWMESLLEGLGNHEQDQQRVDRAIAKISETEVVQTKPIVRSRSWRFASSIAAAAVLVVFAWWIQTNDSTAYALAAVERSLGVAAEPVAREYKLRITLRTAAGRSVNDCRLYVKGADEFALKHPTLLPNTYVWLGRSLDNAWVIPPVGPVLKGGEEFLSSWIESSEDIGTPYLHVTTLLNRMKSRGYTLEQAGSESVQVESGETFECDLISARLELNEDATAVELLKPNRIDLWVNQQSGMTVQLRVAWKLEQGEWGRESVQIMFVGEPELPADWFMAEGHFDGFRPVIDQTQ